MSKAISLLLLLSAFYWPNTSYAQEKNHIPQLIPFPEQLESSTGFFQIAEGELSYTIDSEISSNALDQWVRQSLFGNIPKKKVTHADATLRLIKKNGLSKEGYELTIDKKGIQISASSGQGLFYGLQTIQQLYLLAKPNGSIRLPYLLIKDQPAFQWRS